MIKNYGKQSEIFLLVTDTSQLQSIIYFVEIVADTILKFVKFAICKYQSTEIEQLICILKQFIVLKTCKLILCKL